MRHLLIAVTLTVISLGLAASSSAISWKTYTDSRQVTSVVEHNGEIWAGTGGGVLRFRPDGSGLVKYTNSEGVGDNDISVGIAAGGYIWFGSTAGSLSRFNPSDGSWIVFVLNDREGNPLAINDVATSDDYLWLATSIGISKFDMFRNGGEVKETYRRLGAFVVETPINSIDIRDEILVASSEKGIALANTDDQFLQDYTHWTTAMSENSLGFPNAEITASYIDVSGAIVGTESGLYSALETDSAGVFLWEILGLEGKAVLDIRSSDATFAVTVEDGIFRWESNSLVEYDLSGLPDVSILSSLTTSGGMIVGTSEDGVFLESAGWLNVLVQGPASNAVVGLGSDSRGKIWATFKDPYISGFDGESWDHYELPRSEGSQWALLVDRDDDVWVGTWQNGALRLEGDQVTKFDTTNSTLWGNEDGQSYIVVRDLAIDSEGRIWFPCYLGFPMRPVSFYDPFTDRWDYYTDQEGLDNHDIQSIHVSNNTLWTGYANNGLYKTTLNLDPFIHSGVSSRQYRTSDFLPSDNIRVITSDVNGTVWVGTNAGLAYFDDGIDLFRRVELPSGSGPQINALEVDSRNNLWIGTSNSLALLRADGSGFEVFNTANSRIAGVEITSLFFDDVGFLWVGTSSGLSRLDYDIGTVTKVAEDVIAYPNPFVVPDNGKVFFDYDGVADVSIFTLAGELVKETSTSRGWDGRNEAGERVAGGLYLFYISTPDGQSHTGKIALIRK